MKIEIIKKQSAFSNKDFFFIYIDGMCVDVKPEEPKARERVAEIEDAHLNPAKPEIIYSKEL